MKIHEDDNSVNLTAVSRETLRVDTRKFNVESHPHLRVDIQKMIF